MNIHSAQNPGNGICTLSFRSIEVLTAEHGIDGVSCLAVDAVEVFSSSDAWYGIPYKPAVLIIEVRTAKDALYAIDPFLFHIHHHNILSLLHTFLLLTHCSILQQLTEQQKPWISPRFFLARPAGFEPTTF